MGKVFIVGPAWPLRGGLATFDERLAQEFQAEGNDVQIISFSLQYPNFLFPGTTQYSDEPAPDDVFIHTSINSVNPLSWLKTARYIAKRKPDILVFRYWMPFMSPALGTIARLVKKQSKKTKIVAIADNINPHEKFPFSKQLNTYFLKSMDAFITMSQSVMNELKEYLPNANVKLCPHPLYDNFGRIIPRELAIEQLGLDPNMRYILFFGFIRKYKGLDLLLKAFSDPRLEQMNVRLIVAGEYYDKPDEYERIIQEKGLASRIVMKNDFIPNSEVYKYFCASEVVALTYHSATQSGVTQVAFHFEKAMIATNVGGLEEAVPNGKVGFCVEPTEKAVADALVTFFNDYSVENFREGILEEKEKYSWSKLTSSIKKL